MTAIGMESPPNDLEIRATHFADSHGLTISGGLGAGFAGRESYFRHKSLPF